MARYTYNEGLVSEAIDTLSDASEVLKKTNTEIQKGLDIIYNARGVENIQVTCSDKVMDYTSLIQAYSTQTLEYKSLVVEYIDEMIGVIQQKAQEIEEYESSPWWLKTFSTIGMGALKLVEGLVGSAENIIDGGATLVGFVGGLFSSDFQDSVGEFIKKDWVGDTTAQWYEEGWLKDVNKYSIMAHESTAANIFKGVGNASGYFALSFIPYVGTVVSAVASGVGGVGSGTQAGLQQNKSFNEAALQGLKEGAIDAGITIVATSAAKAIGGIFKGVTAADDVGKAVVSATDDVIKAGANTIDDGINVAAKAASAFDDVAKTTSKFSLKNMTSKFIKATTNTINKFPKTTLAASGASLIGRKVNDARALSANRMEISSLTTLGTELADIVVENSKTTNDNVVINGNMENLLVPELENGNSSELINDNVNANANKNILSSNKHSIKTPILETSVPELSEKVEYEKPSNLNSESTLQNNSQIPNISPEEYIENTTIESKPTDIIVGSVNKVAQTIGNSSLIDTFGNDAKLPQELSKEGKLIIPKSSSPTILSKTNSNNSIVTVGAGIGAAAIGGLGTKNILDIQDRKKESKKNIVTKVWQEEKQSLNDNSLSIKEVDRDYISPVDINAFEQQN